MPEPVNKALYKRIKDDILEKHPKHSAYRSGLIVKEYKRQGGKYRGSKKKSTLNKWFKTERWIDMTEYVKGLSTAVHFYY